MINRVFGTRADEPPRSRLERWLQRKIQGGSLRALPGYTPLGDRVPHCPEQYARSLLNRLRTAHDPWTLERVKDDGRAFRSWAEVVLLALAG
jgi:hypothetical protein